MFHKFVIMTLSEILSVYKPDKSNLLKILHDVQRNNPKQFLEEHDLKEIAKYLNISYSSIYGVATYYSMFSTQARGKYVIRICNSPLCIMKHSNEIEQIVKNILKIDFNETTPDGCFTLEHTACLGHCDKAPVMMINEEIYGNLDQKAIETIIKQIKVNYDK